MTGIGSMMLGAAAAPLLATAPTTAIKDGTTSTITTNSRTCAATGGSGSYTTYAWALSSQSGTLTVTANTPNAATTTFSIIGSVSGDTGRCNAVCTVTDSLGAVAVSNACAVSITNVS